MAGLRHEFQNESAVALRRATARRFSKAWPTARLRFCAATTRRIAIMKRKSSSITRRSASPAWKPNWRLSLMQLVHTKRISLADMIAKFTVNPARLLNLNKGTLSVGADADVTVFDPGCGMGLSSAEIPPANPRTARFSAGSSKARPWRPSWRAK